MKVGFLNILKNKRFVHLWTSQILSQVTINMMNFLLIVRLFEKTNSTLATSLLWISYAIPSLIIGPMASALVDIFDRRKILIITNLLQAVVIFYYTYIFNDNIFLIYGLAFFYSMINQFYVPSENASISFLVDNENIAYANSLFYITQQLSLIFGFGLASIFNQLLGYKATLFACSGFLFLAFVSVIFLPKMKLSDLKHKSVEDSLVTFFKSIYSGYKYIKTSKNILFTFLVLIIVQVMFSLIVISVPTIATEILNLKASLSGIYIVIPAGIGSLLGAVYVPTFLKNKWRKKYLIERSLLVISILLFLEMSVIGFFPQILKIVLSAINIFFIGMFFTGIIIPAQTFLQEHTHDRYKGRIFGNMWFIITLATVIPVIFYGAITEMLGIRFVLASISIACFVMFIFSKKDFLYRINYGQ